eukprot:6199777-Pleurochrysis_carterae.AAC.1
MTGCSSCWDRLGTFNHRFTSVIARYYSHSFNSLNLPNSKVCQGYTGALAGRSKRTSLYANFHTSPWYLDGVQPLGVDT